MQEAHSAIAPTGCCTRFLPTLPAAVAGAAFRGTSAAAFTTEFVRESSQPDDLGFSVPVEEDELAEEAAVLIMGIDGRASREVGRKSWAREEVSLLALLDDWLRSAAGGELSGMSSGAVAPAASAPAFAMVVDDKTGHAWHVLPAG